MIDTDAIRSMIGDRSDNLYDAEIQRSALCDEVDRLRALVRRFYTQAWEDPLTADEERLLDSIVQDADQ